MTLEYVLIIFLIVAIAFFLVWKYAPEPPKTILLWIISIGMVVWVMRVLGFFDWLRGATI